MQPDPELTEEDVCNLLAGTPERIRDQVTGLDASRLTYRHGPGFPTLQEVVLHVCAGGLAADGVIRHACVEGVPEADAGVALEPPSDGELNGEPFDRLDELVRTRRRALDLLRGLAEDAWQRPVGGAHHGDLTLLDFCRLVAAHEMAHLGQIRNLSSLLPE